MSELKETPNWEEVDDKVAEEGDSWLDDDDEADEEEFGSLHPFIKSCVPGTTDQVLDSQHHWLLAFFARLTIITISDVIPTTVVLTERTALIQICSTLDMCLLKN